MNRLTGEFQVVKSNWVDYPGMIALDVMDRLRAACPGSIVPSTKRITTTQQKKQRVAPKLNLATVKSISVCSHTSWVDNDMLHGGFQSSGRLNKLSISLLPSCGDADALVDVRHNSEVTVEWNWTLSAKQSGTELSGRVIAFSARDAVEKIVEQVVDTIDDVGSDECQAEMGRRKSSSLESGPPRRWHLRLMSATADFPVILEIKNGQVGVTDEQGVQLFSLSLDDVDDARVSRMWERPFDLLDPPSLDLISEDPTDGLFILFVLGIFNSTINRPYIPSGIIEIAWRQDDAVRVEAFQASLRQSQLLRRALLANQSAARSVVACKDVKLR